jgi:DNA-binding PadR family transcriptional regulator
MLAQGKYIMGARRDPPVDHLLPLTTVAFEILLAAAEGERHAYDIMLAIERRTAGKVSLNPGTLYRAVDRLVREGLLQTLERRPAGEQEVRKVFRLSRLGARVAAAEAERLADQVDAARVRRLLRRPGRA